MNGPELPESIARLMRYARAVVESHGRNPPGGVSRVVAVGLSLLVVASLLSPFAAVAGATATTGAAGPEGMVGIPDSNVVDETGGAVGLSAEDLRGSVMTDAHPDTLQVAITTASDAGTAVGSDPETASDSLALLLSDDVHEEGRKVAIPRAEMRDALGYVPEGVHVVNDDGSDWWLPAERSGDLLVIDIPHFSSNSVTFSGEINITGDSATDGATFEYSLDAVDSATNPTAEFTGDTATERDDEIASGLGEGDTTTLDVGGNLDPTGPANGEPQVVFTGEESTSAGSASATGATDGTTTQTGISSNAEEIRNGEVTFSGESSTTTATDGGTDGDTLAVGGNLDASGTLTLEGDGSTTSNDQSGSGLSLGSSASFSTGGNVAPVGPSPSGLPELSLTANAGTLTRSTPYGSRVDSREIVGRSGSGTIESDLELRSVSSGDIITSIELLDTFNSLSGDEQFDVYLASEGADGQYGEGTLVASGVSNSDLPTIPVDNYQATSNTVTVSFVTTQGGSSEFDALSIEIGSEDGTQWGSNSAGASVLAPPAISATVTNPPQSVDVTLDGTTYQAGSFSDGETKTIEVAPSASASSFSVSGSGGGSFDWTLDKDDVTGTEDPSATIDGTTYSRTGIYQSGETATFDLTLSPGTRSVSTGSASGPAPTWSTSLTETTATDSPGLDTDGDGQPEASHSGVLMNGETATVTLPDSSLDPSTSSVTTTLAGGSVGWTLDWSRVDYTEDPAVDLDGDGTNEASVSGLLSPGETAAVALPSLSLGSTTATAHTTGGSTTKATFEFRERTQTVSPSFTLNGNTTEFFGAVSDGETVTVSGESAWLQEGTNTLKIGVGDGTLTADAPTPRVELEYVHSATTEVDTTFNGTTWTESFRISKTWQSDRTDASVTVPFTSSSVVGVDSVEIRDSSGEWSTTTDYELDGTELAVSLGSVSTGDTTEVRATASKVRVLDGDITVTNATTPGNALETSFRVESRGPDFALGVGGTEPANRTHYLSGESWSGASPAATITASGTQELALPEANVGGTATARTLPLEVSPQSDVVISVADPTQPRITVAPGETTGDGVEYRWLAATPGETYGLVSESRDGYIIDKAGAGDDGVVTLSAPTDDAATLSISVSEVSGSAAGGGGGGGGGAAAAVVDVDQGDGLLRSPVVVGPLAIALVLGSVIIARRTRIPLTAAGGASVLAAAIAFESLAPGSVSSGLVQAGNAAASGLGTVSPALLLGGGALLLWGLYRLISKFTRREQVNLNLNRGN